MPELTLLDPTKTARQARSLELHLRRFVIGQQEAVQEIVTAYQRFLAGLSAAGRPIANLLFLGPTGSGKTRLVEATAEHLFNDPRAVIKIDCGEFQHSHEIAKLIGSPPGYLGHRETQAFLSQQNLNQYHSDRLKLSLVLFDEIEKASDALWNLLLGILDKGVLTLGDNRRVDFSASMIFMTSNLGAAEMNALVAPRLGFHVTAHDGTTHDAKQTSRICKTATAAARRKFTPEFINRLDKIVVFQSLDAHALRRIVDIELLSLEERIRTAAPETPFGFDVSETARNFLLSEGTDLRYGARPLKRAIERLMVHPLSNLMASGQIESGDRLCVSHDGSSAELSFYREKRRSEYWDRAAA